MAYPSDILSALIQLNQSQNPMTAPSTTTPSTPVQLPNVPAAPPALQQLMSTVGMPAPLPPQPPLNIPAPPIDYNAINQRISSIIGPAPQAPVQQQPSILQRLALALQGFGAGTQGQGPQFLGQLQAQIDKPMDEYRADLARYNATKTNALLNAYDQAQQNAEIERRQNQGFAQQDYLAAQQRREQDIRDQRTAEREDARIKAQQEMADARAKSLQAYQDAKDKDIAKRQQDKDARQAAVKYGMQGAPPTIAKELGDFEAGKIDMISAAANNWKSAQVRKQERLAAGGGGGGKPDVVYRVQTATGQIREIPASSVKTDSYGNYILPQGFQVIDIYDRKHPMFTQPQAAVTQPPVNLENQPTRPAPLEITQTGGIAVIPRKVTPTGLQNPSFGSLPAGITPVRPQGPPPTTFGIPASRIMDRATVQKVADRMGVSFEQAAKDAQANGYVIQ